MLESNSKCKRVYLRPDSADLRSESADLRPMGHDGEGGDNSWTDSQRNKPKYSVFYSTLVYLGPLPKQQNESSFWPI